MTNITFAMPWKDPETGVTYPGGKTADITPATARDLVARGRAQLALAAEETQASEKAFDVPEHVQPEESLQAAAEPEPTTLAEPTGPAKTATATRRGKTKEATPDE